LVRHRDRCRRRARECDVWLRDSAFVFSMEPDGSQPLVPNEVTKRFIRVRRAVGLQGSSSRPETFHRDATLG
jgi:hypothetical protein